jgi:hypothetical protein
MPKKQSEDEGVDISDIPPEPAGKNIAEHYVKVKGQEYAYGVINLDRKTTPGWLSFDRVSTKTGEKIGHMDVSMSEVISIEERVPKEEAEQYT